MFPLLNFLDIDIDQLKDIELTPEMKKELKKSISKRKYQEKITKFKKWLRKNSLTLIGMILSNILALAALIVAILSYLKQ